MTSTAQTTRKAHATRRQQITRSGEVFYIHTVYVTEHDQFGNCIATHKANGTRRSRHAYEWAKGRWVNNEFIVQSWSAKSGQIRVNADANA